jgi:hypothetical protein
LEKLCDSIVVLSNLILSDRVNVYRVSIYDDFVKSPSAALRFIATTKRKDSDRLPVISYRFAEEKKLPRIYPVRCLPSNGRTRRKINAGCMMQDRKLHRAEGKEHRVKTRYKIIDN